MDKRYARVGSSVATIVPESAIAATESVTAGLSSILQLLLHVLPVSPPLNAHVEHPLHHGSCQVPWPLHAFLPLTDDAWAHKNEQRVARGGEKWEHESRFEKPVKEYSPAPIRGLACNPHTPFLLRQTRRKFVLKFCGYNDYYTCIRKPAQHTVLKYTAEYHVRRAITSASGDSTGDAKQSCSYSTEEEPKHD